MRGAVVLAGHCSSADALRAGAELPLRGLILSSMASELLPVAASLNYPIFVVEGFGKIPMNETAYKLLSTSEKRDISINASFNPSAGERPELIIPLPASGQAAPETDVFCTGQNRAHPGSALCGKGRDDRTGAAGTFHPCRMGSIGATTYDLVGYSMGAVVALLVAAQDRRVRRLSVGGVGEGVIVCGGVDTRVMPNLPLAAALEGGAKGDGASAGMVAFVEALGGDRKALAAQLRAVHASPIALDRIAAPTLVLAGDNDPLAAKPEVLANAIAGAKLERLSGDHLRALRDPRCIPALLAHLAP